ncbi:MAG: penicillin-binding protein [bacterium]
MGIKRLKKTKRTRLRWLGVLYCLLFLIILLRSFNFQVINRKPWCNLAPVQYEHRIKLIANRGVIYDRDMNLLAMDRPIISLAVDPQKINDYKEAAEKLSKVLSKESDYYFKQLQENKDRSFVRMAKEISEEQKQSLFRLGIEGLIIIKDRKRIRPFGDLAIQTLGLTNKKHRGVWGIEQSFDQVLGGKDGWAIYQKNGPGEDYFTCPEYPIKVPENGRDIVLTLNHTIQSIVEEELSRGVIKHQAKYGSAVLMNPYTGEILAMASIVGDKLKHKPVELDELIKNRAIQVAREPGSCFKIVTSSAAIQEKDFTPKSLIFCENGKFKVADHIIHDHNNKYAWLTFSQVLEKSSNIGISKVGKKLGKEVLFKYIRNFGFGNKTGIRLPGESCGILRPVYDWSQFSSYAISFGQEISATPLQLVCMMGVIANGGELVKPFVIRQILTSSGETEKIFYRKVIRRVINQKSADIIKEMLKHVVQYGSGEKAAVEGVVTAGKTGTAQKTMPGQQGYVPGLYTSSFVGMWPVDHPQYVMIVMLDEPKRNYWGSLSAAPVFSDIVYRISGISVKPEFRDKKNNKEQDKFVFTNLDFSDNRIASPKNRIIQKSEDKRKKNRVSSPYHMPDVTGLSIRGALRIIGEYAIKVNVEGNGIVVSQSPSPGKDLRKVEICNLVCKIR